MTKRSGSTVYRWLRGESTPDIDDFARMIHGADPPVRERLLAWLSQDLPLRVAWVAGPSDAALAEQPLEHVTAAVKDQTVSAVERLLDTIRWHDSQVGTSPTLSPAQFEDLESRLDDVLNQVMLIKRLHRSRMVERKRARPNA
ncbi:MAG: hypothetical protein ACE37H_16245 [Phycisphaeraceae bacterium]